MSFLQRTAEFFRANPGEWLRATSFESVGGRQAWRSRISQCRTVLKMRIENRQLRAQDAAGRTFVISEYRWVPTQQVSLDFVPLGETVSIE